jgi:hypothetical protein
MCGGGGDSSDNDGWGGSSDSNTNSTSFSSPSSSDSSGDSWGWGNDSYAGTEFGFGYSEMDGSTGWGGDESSWETEDVLSEEEAWEQAVAEFEAESFDIDSFSIGDFFANSVQTFLRTSVAKLGYAALAPTLGPLAPIAASWGANKLGDAVLGEMENDPTQFFTSYQDTVATIASPERMLSKGEALGFSKEQSKAMSAVGGLYGKEGASLLTAGYKAAKSYSSDTPNMSLGTTEDTAGYDSYSTEFPTKVVQREQRSSVYDDDDDDGDKVRRDAGELDYPHRYRVKLGTPSLYGSGFLNTDIKENQYV